MRPDTRLRGGCMVEQLEGRTLLAGVTLLTHGFSGGVRGWIGDFIQTLDSQLGGVSDYTLTIDENDEGRLVAATFTQEPGSPDPDQTPTGEIAVRLDWGDISEGQYSTTAVAEVAAEFLRSAGLIGGVPLAQLPIHVIGHSRGGSLLSALAHELSEAGLWVQQMTTLDPHPVDSVDDPFGADFGDFPMQTAEGVIFADNYWRADDNLVDVNGEPVPGAYNLDLTGVVEATLLPPVMAHDYVKAYYYGTLAKTADDLDGDEIDSDWYGNGLPERDQTGWLFSRLGGGARPGEGLAEAFGGDAARTAVAPVGLQWANVGEFAPRDTTVAVGEALYMSFTAQDRDTSAEATFFLDEDLNPFNDNIVRTLGHRTFAASDGLQGFRLRGNTTDIAPGTYYIYGKVTDSSGHTRYASYQQPITITALSEAQMFAAVSGGVLTANGTSGSDRFYLEANDEVIAITRDDVTQTFSRASVGAIEIRSEDGDDRIVAADGFPGFYALGGAGDDTLIGAGGDDTLTGAGGQDSVTGGLGSDLLSGSGGHDRLFALDGLADIVRGDAGIDLADVDDEDSVTGVENLLA